ncbi:CDP-diacylglycerol/glycerol-3-phosphate 3-phosphatidyltransferase [Thermodesulfatator indicus DSM 15286]|uniref:CDP-diacylglycerol--glycerol-3-phosphate 3-phosphatidyltransferase n=1 Tax=Thermodesulfatator indicus (strain DSM 15286 / JCM 11887 / CIR29812) TaxID=667014 RepID=F8ACT2_THEID|nr:CDP-alcohol phosphatidyltransferase family protein [Thermodesulfatator indicus]AEH44723.1 CDP-diacylglycerol/glycerol-3-phosphate 3-phosphatidyltransferase [Thermodesulfatator indicus DSM 15286]
MINIPNLVTILRLCLVPVVISYLLAGDHQKALIFFLIAGLSDVLDGFLARRLNQKTLLGAILDPIADKTLVDSIYLLGAYLELLPKWLAVIVVGRDFLILLGFLCLVAITKKIEVRPTYLSKATTAIQVITVVATLAKIPNLNILFYLTGVFTVLSGLHYLWLGVQAKKRGA